MMIPEGQLLVEKKGRVLLLTIENPAVRNALSPTIYAGGAAALEEAANDASIGAVVIVGADGHFSSGGNIQRIQVNRDKSKEESLAGISKLHSWVQAIRQCPKPVLAAVEGMAAGAGFSLALACDLLVAAEDSRFTAAHVKIGISPDGGISAFLSRALPPQAIAEMLLQGGIVHAERLERFGIVNRLCDKGEALNSALEWAEQLAAGPLHAMGRIKHLVERAYCNDLNTQLDLERQLAVEGIFHEECGEGVAAFLSKRTPVFIQREES